MQVAYAEINDEFNRVWHDEFVTWTVPERLSRVLARLNASLPEQSFNSTVEALECLEIDVPPKPIDGAYEALSEISKNFPLAVVSDTINTPGTGLRKWLEMHDLKQFFKAFAFSDEVGHSKPHQDMFARALDGLGAEFKDAVHIGRSRNTTIFEGRTRWACERFCLLQRGIPIWRTPLLMRFVEVMLSCRIY